MRADGRTDRHEEAKSLFAVPRTDIKRRNDLNIRQKVVSNINVSKAYFVGANFGTWW